MIYIILGRLTKDTADDYARPEDDEKKESAEERAKAIEAVVKLGGGELESIYWTLGEYDVAMTVQVGYPPAVAAIALALARRIGMTTTTLTGFTVEALQAALDGGGYAGHTEASAAPYDYRGHTGYEDPHR